MQIEDPKAPAGLRMLRALLSPFRSVLDRGATLRTRVFAVLHALLNAGLVAALLVFVYALVLIPFTPSIDDIRKARIEQPAVLMSEDGKRLAEFKRSNREWVPLERVSPHAVKALIAAEDHRFYQHFGIDLRRTASSILYTLSGNTQGGSTITQQLARNLYPEEIGRERTLTRKLKEMITALKIEHAYSKREILETYLNTVPFLYNAFGIEMAARTYFDKSAAKLSLLESATLVGMLKGTYYYNPVLNPERAVKRRNVVLAQMVKHGVLSQQQFDSLKNRRLRLDFERQQEQLGPAPHFTQQARRWLIDWADRNDYNLYSDGLIIHTTIDSRLQEIANQAVARQTEALQAIADVEWAMASDRLLSTNPYTYQSLRSRVRAFGHFWRSRQALVDSFIRETPAFRSAVAAGAAEQDALASLKKDEKFMAALKREKTTLQAGFLAIDPATGHVKAWVGSRDFETDQFDHVAQAARQPGSTFKPFVYGAALEKGIPSTQSFVDGPVEIRMPDGTVWSPTDMSGPSGRDMTLREALVQSKNTITAQLIQEIGPWRVASLARAMGVDRSRLEPVPALALGTSPVTLFEMVSAYATLAAGGEYRKPLWITRITDRKGKVLAEFDSAPKQALSRETADELVDILREAVDRGTARGIRHRFGIGLDVAGKTGTTQNNADGWFVLMHPRLVSGAWVGFNDQRIAMRSAYWGQGGHNALLLVGDFFRRVSSARLIDTRARFPDPRPESLLGPWLERAGEWLGIFDRRDEGGKEAKRAPVPPARDDGDEGWLSLPALGELSRMIDREARELQKLYEQERRRIEGWFGEPAQPSRSSRAEAQRRAEERRREQEAFREAERQRDEERLRQAPETPPAFMPPPVLPGDPQQAIERVPVPVGPEPEPLALPLPPPASQSL